MQKIKRNRVDPEDSEVSEVKSQKAISKKVFLIKHQHKSVNQFFDSYFHDFLFIYFYFYSQSLTYWIKSKVGIFFFGFIFVCLLDFFSTTKYHKFKQKTIMESRTHL